MVYVQVTKEEKKRVKCTGSSLKTWLALHGFNQIILIKEKFLLKIKLF